METDRDLMIDELLAIWRETPASEVAELIAQVSATDARPPITGGSQRALHAAWLEVERANDPGDTDRLLAVLASGKLTQASERMERLARRPSDPRVAAGLEALLAAPPSAAFVKTASTKFWDAVCAELARIADPRTRSIAERAAWLANDRVPSPFDVGRNRARMAKAILKVAADIAPAPELPAAQRQRIASLAARIRSIPKRVDRSAELLARIYEDPRDLDARAVYADWLIASGDPRGELIALQLARPLPKQPPWRHFEHEREHKRSTREQQLLRVHAGAWLGRLGTSLENVSFERGFPTWAHLATDADIVTVALPEASTLEYLAVDRDDFGTGQRLAARPFHGLASLSTIGWRTLAGLVEQPGATVRAVEIADTTCELLDDFAFLESEVRLDELDLQLGHLSSLPPPTGHVRALVRCRLVQQLRKLTVGWNVGNEAAFVEAFAASAVEQLEFSSFGIEPALHLAHERDGLVLRIVCNKAVPKVPDNWPRALVARAVLELLSTSSQRAELVAAASVFTRGDVELVEQSARKR